MTGRSAGGLPRLWGSKWGTPAANVTGVRSLPCITRPRTSWAASIFWSRVRTASTPIRAGRMLPGGLGEGDATLNDLPPQPGSLAEQSLHTAVGAAAVWPEDDLADPQLGAVELPPIFLEGLGHEVAGDPGLDELVEPNLQRHLLPDILDRPSGPGQEDFEVALAANDLIAEPRDAFLDLVFGGLDARLVEDRDQHPLVDQLLEYGRLGPLPLLARRQARHAQPPHDRCHLAAGNRPVATAGDNLLVTGRSGPGLVAGGDAAEDDEPDQGEQVPANPGSPGGEPFLTRAVPPRTVSHGTAFPTEGSRPISGPPRGRVPYRCLR